ncbi:MAG: hypothetical protein IMF11_20765, partial [Proteobacteria bacterium]|nr:hypothetical protein [Pseudomonadota bacterium]
EPDGTYANMSSVETVEESVDKLLDVRTALQSLKPKLDEAKQTLGFGYFWWLLFLAPIPECLIRLIGRRLRKSLIETQNKSHAITNVGVIPENAGDFGHAHVLSYSILPPVSPRPNVFFVMHSFKGALTVNMSFSSKHMKPDTAKAFLEKWRQQFMSL